MRLLFLVLFTLVVLLFGDVSAHAFPWPVKPFGKQHPIRANFGDPRTRFLNTMLTNGLDGPGTFAFHNGIDIAAPPDTPVYPVISGTARFIDLSAISVRTKGRGVFQYFHIVPTVRNGERVVAGKTILGYVMQAYDHVHLSWIRGGRVWNPLARDGIAPYRDRTVPAVDAINIRPSGSLIPFDSDTICGIVSIVAAAHDVTPIPVSGAFGGFPVSPALVTWSMYRIGGSTYVRDSVAADFRTTLPSVRTFWNVYARGSYQNAPRFSNRQYFMPGQFLYNLVHELDTRDYPNGRYQVVTHVADMRGNNSDGALQFAIDNHSGTETGCPAHAPSSAP